MNRNALPKAEQWNGPNLIGQKLRYTTLCRSSEIRIRATETGTAGKRNAASFKIEVSTVTTYSIQTRM